jgi:hypothetical protein
VIVSTTLIPTLVLTSLVAAWAPCLLLHEGHGVPQLSGTVAHQLLEPQHAWPAWLAVAVVSALTIALARRHRARRGSGRPSP